MGHRQSRQSLLHLCRQSRDGPRWFSRLGDLARADVPVLQICGTIDPILGKNASAIEAIYQQFGGRISMMIKEGYAHHPHSLRNPSQSRTLLSRACRR